MVDTSSFSQLVAERAIHGAAPLLSGRGAQASPGNPLAHPNQPAPSSPQTPSSSAERAPRSTARNAAWAAEKEKQRAALNALKQKVDSIQVALVMPLLGGIANQDKDRSKWKIPGTGNITVTGQRWYNLNEAKGSIGPINLVMHALNLDFPKAVYWLAESFGESIDNDDIKAALSESGAPEKKSFSPPSRYDKNISFVKHYLHFTRALPMPLIEELIAQNKIYADEQRNCVFFSDGIAEIRSSFDGEDAVKKLAPGSTRQKGFLVLADPALNERKIAICESAIDSISFRAMNPGCSAISSAGAGREFPRRVAEDAVDNGFAVVAAFDADEAGDKASQALFNHFYLKLWITHKLKAEKGIDVDEDALFEALDNNIIEYDLKQGDPDDPAYNPATLPNTLFFNQPAPFSDPDRKPLILLTIKRNELGLPECSGYELEVSERGYRYVIDKLHITRRRPGTAKDWNEILKQQRATLAIETSSSSDSSAPRP